MDWRRRLARWLIGPFLTISEDGTWLVHREGEMTVAMRVAEFEGTMTTRAPSLTGWQPGDRYPDAPTTTGTFTGRFEN